MPGSGAMYRAGHSTKKSSGMIEQMESTALGRSMPARVIGAPVTVLTAVEAAGKLLRARHRTLRPRVAGGANRRGPVRGVPVHEADLVAVARGAQHVEEVGGEEAVHALEESELGRGGAEGPARDGDHRAREAQAACEHSHGRCVCGCVREWTVMTP